MQEHMYDPESGSSSGATHVPDQASAVLSPRTLPRCDSGLPCDSQNGTGITGSVFLTTTCFKEDYFLQSSTIQRIWHPPHRNWGLMLPKQQGKERVKWKENRWTRRFFHPTSRVGVACWTILVEFILTMVWCYFEIKSWLYGISKLESNFKNEECTRTVDAQITMHWFKEVGIAKVNRRTCYIAIDCGANRFPWLRCAWCDDCVCIEKASQHADTCPKESKCRRATLSKIRPILSRETNCAHDLWVFPCNPSLWSSTRILRLVHCKFTEWRR